MSQVEQDARPNDLYLSWDDVAKDAVTLVEKLKEVEEKQGFKWKGIVAITTGGLAPAGLVAKGLGVRIIETLCAQSYSGQSQSEVQVLKAAGDHVGDGEGWLVIDELTDSGRTFKALRESALPKAYYACIYAKTDGRDTADCYAVDIDQDIWIHFPWEKFEEMA